MAGLISRARVRGFGGAIMLGAAALGAANAAPAAEIACRPVSIELVAKAWNDFVAQDDIKLDTDNDQFQCVTSSATRSSACQTMPNHPAHPSVVVRRVVRAKGGWFVNTVATTAAPCEAFRAMLRHFDALTAAQREQLARERAAAEAAESN